MKHCKSLIFIILFLLAPLQTLAETIPLMIPHTGTIKVNGRPFNGLGQFKFAITNRDQECTLIPFPGSACKFYWTNESISPISTKEPASFVTLPISNGIFTVRLGDVTLTDMQTIPAAVFENATTELRVWFNDGVKGFQWLSPDRQLVSVPYAYHAETAKNIVSGGVTSTMIANNAVTTTQVADGTVTTTQIADKTIGIGDLAFDPATQDELKGELNTHKESGDHDTLYLLKNGDTMTGPLEVAGDIIRTIAHAQGYGVDTTCDVVEAACGPLPLPERKLTFTKKKASTKVRVQYTDTMRSYGLDNVPRACQWEVRFDTVTCPTGAIRNAVYSSNSDIHRGRTLFGYCGGLAAGPHVLQVYVQNVQGFPSGCYTGWPGNTNWTIEAEEVN